MSAKSELIKVLTNYRNAYEQVRAQIDQIRKNPDYTEDGKVNLIDPIVTNFVPSVDQARQAAAAGKRRESPAYARLQRALGELTALVRRCAGCPNKGLNAFSEELERLTARWRDRLAP